MRERTVSKKISFFHFSERDPERTNLSKRHQHAKYELLYIVRGEGEYVTDHGAFPIRAGSLCLSAPKEYHAVRLGESHTYERYVINFTADALPEEAQELLTPFRKVRVFHSQELVSSPQKSFEKMRDFLIFPEKERLRLLALCLEEIMTISFISYRKKQSDSSEAKESNFAEEIKRYLDENLEQKITLDALSEKFFVSKYYLCHSFKNNTGQTVLQYLTNRRLEKARALIQNGTSATLAAEKCGFGDYSAFYRAHKKHLGIPPSLIPPPQLISRKDEEK